MVINQWVPAAHLGDAVGDSARRVRTLLRERNHSSEIYALTIDDELQGDVRPFSDPDARRGDITILHFAIPSPMTDALAHLRRGRVLQYHNITPAKFFAPYHTEMFRIAALGRQDLTELVGRVDVAFGDSEYNRKELEALGFENTGVMPIAVDIERLHNESRLPAMEKVLRDGLANILFVGRIAPNKCVEDHIRLAEHYKRYVDTEYRFIFVGRTDAVPSYYAAVRGLIATYHMPADRFLFPGQVTAAELATYYRTAHAYVSLSEHEGFCVPLVEAMATDVPILAYAAAAIPETLGGAGLCFAPKDLEYVAELLGMVVYDNGLRAKLVAGQRRRVTDFGQEAVARHVDQLVARFG